MYTGEVTAIRLYSRRIGELEANEAVVVIQLHWLTVELGRLLWPMSSAQPVDGGCWLRTCRTAVRWRSPVWTTHESVFDQICGVECEQWSL